MGLIAGINQINQEAEHLASRRNLIGFWVQGFFYSMVVGSVSLLVPLYAIGLGSNHFELGLITGSRGMGHFLLVIPVGLLLDRFGIRKVFSLSSFASFMALLLIPAAQRPLTLLIFACAEGLACSSRLTAMNARSFKVLPFLKPSQTGWYKGISSVGGTIIGPLLATHISEKFGFTAAFLMIAGIVLFANLLELGTGPKIGLGRADIESQERISAALKGTLLMLRNRTVMFASYGEALVSAFNSSSRILLILLVVETMQRSSTSLSAITSMIGGAYLIVVFLCGSATKHWSEFASYFVPAVFMITSLILMAFTHNMHVIYAAALLAGVGQGGLSLASYKTISTIQGDNGKVAGIITLNTGLTICFAPMLISFIVEMLGLTPGFLALLFPFLMLPVVFLLKNRVHAGSAVVHFLRDLPNKFVNH